MYVVILAGGGGTRLWPLSRRARPKPFLTLFAGGTLLQRTVARVEPLVGLGGIYVVVERRHAALVDELRLGLPAGHLLAEPEGRNTAAAIALAAIAIDRPADEAMVVLPADHLIVDEDRFRGVLAASTAPEGIAHQAFGIEAPLVTLGIRPDPARPETGYGYLVPRVDRGGDVNGLAAYPLEAFVEKPPLALARELVGQPGVAWNAGMFVWRRGAILEALGVDAPDILAGVRAAFDASEGSWPLEGEAAAARYREVRATSIDYAVMEPAARRGRVVMAGMEVGWSDIGSWSAVRDQLARSAAPAGASVLVGRVEDLDSRDILVESAGGRLVVTIGLRDTIVVDTPDALLVCAADRAQDVKQIVDRLNAARESDRL